MPKNPSTSHVTSAKGAGMPNQNNLNNPRSYNNEGYNTFDRSNARLFTTRFADFHPNFCQPGLEGDVVRLNMRHELRSLNMKTPFFTPVQMEQHFFQVPWSAIAPNTWKLFLRQPVKGQDISEDVKPYWDLFNYVTSLETLPQLSSSKVSFTDAECKTIISNLIVCYLLFGNDSLTKNLGFSAPEEVATYADKAFARLVNLFNDGTFDSPAAGTNPRIVMSDNGQGSSATFFLYRKNGPATTALPVLTLSERYDIWSGIARGDYGYIISCNDLGNQGAQGSTLNEIVKLLKGIYTAYTDALGSDAHIILDMYRIVAYQLICAQYVSNSNVDDIYTGEMFLQNLTSLFNEHIEDVAVSYFTYNGTRYAVDLVCRRVGDNIIYNIDTASSNDYWSILVNLFAIHRSLRFGDYFLNARTQPLAVGDNYIEVSEDNKISVIDVTQRQWFQRFRNAVNRTSQNINEYLLSITGVQRQRIEPQPNFICSQSFNLSGQEIEGTNYDQNTSDENPTTTITTLRSGQSRYMFEVFIDEPSYIIGCVSFNAKYVYPRATDKEFLMTDRFDWFNSFLQHIGDQEIMKHEMDASYDHDIVYGYTLRYAQFKYGLSHATGGFSAHALPSWSLMMPEKSQLVGPWRYDHINSNVLRNTDVDFDQFFPSLTGADAAHRFHFIISSYNSVPANSKQQDFPTLM